MAAPIQIPELIYKIATGDVVWKARESGIFTGMPIDEADGYLHFSTATQLPETLRLHFRGQGGVVILAVRSSDMGSALRWEPSRGGQLFPHVYGTFPIAGVVHEATIDIDPEGNCVLPEWVR
jgi:uncharacterized protein (DUF952 family)